MNYRRVRTEQTILLLFALIEYHTSNGLSTLFLKNFIFFKKRLYKPKSVVYNSEAFCEKIIIGLVVQLVRTLACHARGRGFEPHPGRHFADIAQAVERILGKDEVAGSIPAISSKKS